MTTNIDNKEARKEQILAAAAEVFSKMGFHKARMDDIVAESGLSKGTLYWYFKSKDDIILALLEQFYKLDLEDLQAIINRPDPALQRITDYVETILTQTEQFQHLIAITYEFYAQAIRREDVQEFLSNYFVQYEKVFATILQQGIERGEVRQIDPHKASFALIAVLEGTTLMWQIQPDKALKERMLFGLNLMLDGLRP